MPAPKIKILIADDMIELRSNIRRMLSSYDNIKIVGEAGDGESTIEQIKQLKPHIVLLDINLPKIDGLKVTEIITKEFPQVLVIIISVQGELEYLRRAMKAGAKDYLTKPFSANELIESINNTYNKWLKDQITAHEKLGQIISIFATKGGVGRTTIATNLAISLAISNKKTLLFDASFQFGDVAISLNMKANKNIFNVIEKESEINLQKLEANITKHPSGLDVLLAPVEPAYAEAIKPSHIKFIIDSIINDYDYIIIDTATTIGPNELQILDMTDLVLLIGTLEISSLKNTKLFVKTLNDIKYDLTKVKLVINKDIPNVGISKKDIEQGLSIPVFAAIPMDAETAQMALNQGEPFVLKFKKTPLAKAVEELASKILGDNKLYNEVYNSTTTLAKIKKFIFG